MVSMNIKNKEDIFLIGLIIVIIVLVVTLFMSPAKVVVGEGAVQGSGSIEVGNVPREAIQDLNQVKETIIETEEEEPEEEPEPEAEIIEPTIITLEVKDGWFTPRSLTVKSGTILMFINNDEFRTNAFDMVSFGRHTYSPKIKPGESWSIEVIGPATYYVTVTGFQDTRKVGIKVKG